MLLRTICKNKWSVKSISTKKSSFNEVLTDTFGRKHNYLRVSLTERCNLRCEYCMPLKGAKLSEQSKLLSNNEIVRLVSLFAKQGVDKIRITGGEPTVKKDIIQIVESLRDIRKLKTIAMTTNGLTLTKHLVDLQRAGLNALNVSLDTLQENTYGKITRRDGRLLKRVLAGIDLALQLGFSPVKMYRVPGFAGSIGFISSMTDDYCDSCNRLRLMADGNLKACLFQNNEISLRDPLREGASDEELLDIISNAVKDKKRKHAVADRTKSVVTVIRGGRLTRNVCKASISGHHARNICTGSGSGDDQPRLTHVDGRSGDARMVDVSGKRETRRTATAVAQVRLDATATRLIAEDACKKGDVLSVARLAGICAAKATWQLIPLCHQIRLDSVTVDARLDERRCRVHITATAVSTDRTGVEMECLTACSVAALTVYDMCKAVTRDMVIEHVKLLSKTGGKTDYRAKGNDDDYSADD
ncbi:molybdenum cofactor biosynthesis protein 1 isoform X2 [Acyrthosiphon pisum]|uniref:Radical SAM core domain-containing protein n=1 Tax=Acyrthosiphon pisum TaxID=7029 RepID=A0A8R2A749_ACYPI|nr:molybdenum cofactor biosynthesis protein 1 isoform X2 [Acyrthosiphon pisum]|eukprot:XP_003240643.1 PREDICTED: molybdenum cofactor biosynthesis protein 1 isoform X3 [Acyrthosiphon pisum]